MTRLVRRALPLALLPLLATSAACDLMTAGMRGQATAEWHKTYQIAANGRVDIDNTNGKIEVEPSTGTTVDVVAIKKVRGADDNAAKAALNNITIAEDVSPSHVKIQTKYATGSGGFHLFGGGNGQVEYHVKVPASVELHVGNTNGDVTVDGVQGSVFAETTNGGIDARNVAGKIDAETTNGGVDVEVAHVSDSGITLGCTNGHVSLTLPKDAKATISARVTNGGIDTGNLPIEASGDNTRRRFNGRLNGGGPKIELETTNGAVTISGK